MSFSNFWICATAEEMALLILMYGCVWCLRGAVRKRHAEAKTEDLRSGLLSGKSHEGGLRWRRGLRRDLGDIWPGNGIKGRESRTEETGVEEDERKKRRMGASFSV